MIPALTASAWGAAIVMPSGTGVCIHFLGGHTNELRMIAGAGFKFVRTDCTWSDIERQKGHYEWAAQDELTRDLSEFGLHPVYVLDYSNPLYERNIDGYELGTGKAAKVLSAPVHPESVAALGKWCAAAANRYRGKQVIWEIYNEPNIIFWQPQPGAHSYAALAIAASKAIREADPDAVVVAPALNKFDLRYLETTFKDGLLPSLDAVTVHPYRRLEPETASADYQALRDLIARHAPAGRAEKIPIIDESEAIPRWPNFKFLSRFGLHTLSACV